MLVAEKQDGKLFSLLDPREKKELLAVRNNEMFYCPICRESVQMRLGDRRRWHFAHRRGTACPYEAEAESVYHLQGKRLLFEWLERQSVQVKLEPYLSRLKQRPDLLLHTSPQHIALEFQCATMDPDLMTKRTKTFQQGGLMPIWILGGNRLKRVGTETFSLPQMDALTLRKAVGSSSHLFAIYFSPESKQFAVLSNVQPYSNSKVIAQLHYHPLSSFSVEDLYRMSPSPKFTIPKQWLSIKKQWRLNAFRSRSAPHLYVQKLYGYLSLFPPAAGWPTPHLYHIATPCFLWQSWLFHQFYLNGQEKQPIRLGEVKKAFRSLVRRNIFQVRSFPYIPNEDEGLAIFEYLKCLAALGFLRQTGRTEFRKNKQVPLPGQTEDYIRLDCEYFEKLARIL